MKAGSSQDAVQLLLASERWEEAHSLARTCMAAEEVNSLYISTAQQQEEKGKYREAERWGEIFFLSVLYSCYEKATKILYLRQA